MTCPSRGRRPARGPVHGSCCRAGGPYPGLRLGVGPEHFGWRPGVLMQGLTALPIALHAPRST